MIFARIPQNPSNLHAIVHQNKCRRENDPFNFTQISRPFVMDSDPADWNSLSLARFGVDNSDLVLPCFTPFAKWLIEHYQFGRSRRRSSAKKKSE